MTDEKQDLKLHWPSLAMAAALLALGLFVRAYHYNEESVCLEEWVGFKYLDAPNLLTYIEQTRDLYKTMAPLYYATEYLWTRVFGPSVESVRVISVLAGTLVLPLIYLFAWQFFGRGRFARRAALIATACAALSPMHVFHSQEARQYSFFVLMGMLSAYTLLRASREGRWRWWAANMAANLAVSFTHPFGILLPFAEGFYILVVIVRRREFKRTGAWIAVHVAIAALALLWIRDMPKDPSYVFGPYTPVLSVHRIVTDIVGDDIPGMTSEFSPTGKTWGFLPSSFANMNAAHGRLRPILICFSLAAIGWTVWRIVRAFLQKGGQFGNAEGGPSQDAPVEDYLLLLLWLLVPPLVLSAMSIFDPCHMPRYTVYCSLALYVMLGGALASLPWLALRGPAAAAVLALLAYFLSIGVPGLNNVDWRSMAKLVHSGSPDDVILVHGTDYLNILQFHLGQNPTNPTASVMSREGLCEITDFFLSECSKAQSEKNRQRAVWNVIILDNGPPGSYESCMRTKGLKYEKSEFPGLRHFFVYRVTRKTPGSMPPPQFEPMTNFAKIIAESLDNDEIKRFRRQISWDLDSWGGHYLRLGMMLIEKGEVDLGAPLLSKTLEIHPQYVSEWVNIQRDLGDKYPLDSAVIPALRKGLAIRDEAMKWWVPSGWLTLGDAYVRQHDYANAIDCLNKSLKLSPSPQAWFTLGGAYFRQHDYANAIDCFNKSLELDPNPPGWFWFTLGEAYLHQDDYANAIDCLNKSLKLGPNPEGWFTLGGAYLRQHDYANAIKCLNKSLELDPNPQGWFWFNLGEAYVYQRDYPNAIKCLNKSLELDSNCPAVYGFLTMAYMGAGDDASAEQAARKFVERDAQFGSVFGTFLDNLFSKKYDAAWSEVKRLREQNVQLPEEFVRKLERDSGHGQQ